MKAALVFAGCVISNGGCSPRAVDGAERAEGAATELGDTSPVGSRLAAVTSALAHFDGDSAASAAITQFERGNPQFIFVGGSSVYAPTRAPRPLMAPIFALQLATKSMRG